MGMDGFYLNNPSPLWGEGWVRGKMKTHSKSKPRNLRKNSTDAEKRMWSLLRNRQLVGYKFRRQHPIKKFIVDFACPEELLAIEIDGGQHVESKKVDDERTQFLETQGYRVLRFWNDQVLKETEAVLEVILKALEEK